MYSETLNCFDALMTASSTCQALGAAAVGEPKGDMALAAMSLGMPWRTSRPCSARKTNSAVSDDVQ